MFELKEDDGGSDILITAGMLKQLEESVDIESSYKEMKFIKSAFQEFLNASFSLHS